jgi:cellobiose-specific phosphotransferase system component IIA
VLESEFEDSNTAREKEVLVNEINTLKCVLGHLYNLKPGRDEIRTSWIAEANDDFQQAKRIRKQLIKMQDTESEISSQCSYTKLRSTS